MSDYDTLKGILAEAANQAEFGKGKERHANGEPWDDQLINFLSRFDFCTGQAIKKLIESHDFFHANGNNQGAIDENLGAINYIAARINYLKKQDGDGTT